MCTQILHRKLYYFNFQNYIFSILKNGILDIEVILINDRIVLKATEEARTRNIK